MLILQRDVDETITITVPPSTVEQVITITVTEIRCGGPKKRVKLGIRAEKFIRIMRDDAVKREPAEEAT